MAIENLTLFGTPCGGSGAAVAERPGFAIFGATVTGTYDAGSGAEVTTGAPAARRCDGGSGSVDLDWRGGA